MRLSTSDTIAAIATAPGRGGIGIVRVSGPSLGPFIYALLGRSLEPRHASYGPFPDAEGTAIDQGIAIFFFVAVNPFLYLQPQQGSDKIGPY